MKRRTIFIAILFYLFSIFSGALLAQTQVSQEQLNAANNGDADVQYYLGCVYMSGIGAEQNYRESARWLRKASDQGHPSAQHMLGFLYYSGSGVDKNKREAARLFQKAAEQGLVDAQTMTSAIYYLGDGVIQSYEEAYFWLTLALTIGIDNDNIKYSALDMKSEMDKEFSNQLGLVKSIKARAQKWLDDKDYGLIVE